MELRGATVLLLGGSGLVGTAIARRLLSYKPERLILTGLLEDEVKAALAELSGEAADVELEGVWGNIFLPEDISQLTRQQIVSDPAIRRRLVDDLLGPFSGEALESNLLYTWLARFRPDAVVDTINTATALAYQDIYASAKGLLSAADGDADGSLVDNERIELHLLTLELPQLIRHVQIVYEGMRRAGTKAYVKIGTSGTGGMGLNIPYTHSEERPSRTLMTKAAVAGAHSMFLFLLGRTPGAPAIIEVKPTAAIGWREIAFGPIRRGGRVLELVDCTKPLDVSTAFESDSSGWSRTGKPLESVFINVGENGVFARDEFETVTSLGQMELVTPEEIADVVALEMTGHPTGKDIVAALDGATFGPTYRAGYLRSVALDGLKALEESRGVRSVAFEMLGPPRLTKLLYEAFVMSRIFGNVRELSLETASALCERVEKLLVEDEHWLRQQILSVGLPILMPDGCSILRGEVVVVQPPAGGGDVAARGWIDLREENMGTWIGRAASVCGELTPQGTGSARKWNAINADAPIQPAAMAVWIFENEDGGFRTKR